MESRRHNRSPVRISLEEIKKYGARLGPKYLPVLLAIDAGPSYKAAAEILGMKLNTLKSRRSRAAGMLAEWRHLDSIDKNLGT